MHPRFLALFAFGAFSAAPALAGGITPCPAEGQPSEVLQTRTFVASDGQHTLNNLETDGWSSTNMIYGGFHADAEGCALVQLSLHTLQSWLRDGTNFGGDYVAVQVLLDDKPMYGHTTACKDPNGDFVSCLVLANNVDDKTRIDAHSYQLVLPVTEGDHRLRVIYAGTGDGPSQGAYVGGVVMTVHHP